MPTVSMFYGILVFIFYGDDDHHLRIRPLE